MAPRKDERRLTSQSTTVNKLSPRITMRLITGLAILLGSSLARAAASPDARIPQNNNTIPGTYIVEFADSHVSGMCLHLWSSTEHIQGSFIFLH